MSKEKPKIFISHSWEDNELAKKLEENLKRDSAEIWVDYDKVKAGDSFIERMNEGLEWCNTLILLWSNSAAKSKWVKKEWQGALADEIKIIPCLIDDKELPRILKNLLYKDLSNFDEGYNSLADDLSLIIKEEPPEAVKQKIAIFRSKSQALSEDDVKSMLKKYDFFDNHRNRQGKGFDNKFELKTINGDKVVIDNASGLMWQPAGSSTPMLCEDDALEEDEDTNARDVYIHMISYAGYDDWRFPSLEEAMTLIKPNKTQIELYIDSIFDKKQTEIWTSDWLPHFERNWVVSFSSGLCYHYDIYNKAYYRFVRLL